MASPVCTSDLSAFPDPGTDNRLLPLGLTNRDNSRKIRHYKHALHKAMDRCLTPLQREQIQLFYWQGLRKTEIARRQNRTCSAVSKSIKAGQAAIQEYVDLYMDIYSDLEQELLWEEDG